VVDTGVPHGVVFVEDLNEHDFVDVARPIRFHPQFSPEGINVNFAQMLPDGSVAVRTYERGVEEETLSCGTGAAAVGWLAAQQFSLIQPIKIRNKERTHILEVLSSETKGIELWGQAVHVFEGYFHTDFHL
ncbi:MAG: diaminopimelate epimerase, partial [Verrucomicrobia bacterium]|nr:diaminopimelate epimerase [Verrucomicrobiota bacterium]